MRAELSPKHQIAERMKARGSSRARASGDRASRFGATSHVQTSSKYRTRWRAMACEAWGRREKTADLRSTGVTPGQKRPPHKSASRKKRFILMTGGGNYAGKRRSRAGKKEEHWPATWKGSRQRICAR
mmetsp:Transcript_30260/g.80112  ORF Transcript_30260/g.80112 Transcript_30260/m.80112 type:complete len:128 (-) Transcript_30260:209-592(-)